MNAFYAGALLTLILSVTTLKIDMSSIPAYQASIRPITLQQIFLSMWFKVEGQVVERWERPTSTLPIGRGRGLAVIWTLQLTLVGAASTLGHALRVGKEWKMAAYAEACHAVGVLFVPLVVESMGRWSDKAIHTITSIGRLQGQRLAIPLSESIQHLFQRLAISLWKDSATLWIRRQPVHPANVDGLI